MKRDEMDRICMKEKTAVKSILESNAMNMTRVVNDRLTILKAIHAYGVEYKEESVNE